MNPQDKSFLTVFTGIMTVLVLLTTAIFLISRSISLFAPAPDAATRKQITAEDRIEPIGKVVVAEPGKEEAVPVERSGEEIVASVCSACHSAGVLGAPKTGDEEAWAARFERGLDALVQSAVTGVRAMPPKGGDPNLTEDDIRKAVTHMLKESGIEVAVAEEEAAPTAPEAEEEAAPEAEEEAAPETEEEAAPEAEEEAAPEAEEEAAPEAEEEAAPEAEEEAAPELDLAEGEQVYKGACFACHDAGVAGAPKKDDTAAWQPRAEQGFETLVSHAINGFKAMPPKGGNPNLSDEGVRNAVGYILTEAGIEIESGSPATQEEAKPAEPTGGDQQESAPDQEQAPPEEAAPSP